MAFLGCLGALQASPGPLRGGPWDVLGSLGYHLLSRGVNLGVSLGLIWVAGRLLNAF